MQFHWQLLITNSCSWLFNILLRKFDISLKKQNENDKNTDSMMKNNKKFEESTCKHKVAFFILNLPTDPWQNMLQFSERQKNIGDKKFSVEHTLKHKEF